MEISGNPLALLNLMGLLSEIDYRPKSTGNYSTVYLGSLNGTPVAIKAIKATGGEDSVRRKLLRDITLWAGTNHQNILPFYGFVNDEWFGPFGALVSPWCTNGDATQYLKENGERMVPAEHIALWRGVIEGVAYLHEHEPIIVHGDLKPGNVLIDDHGIPRICDFGLARVLLEVGSTGMTTTSEHTGTTRYLAPELVQSEVNVPPTTASDMYALGCLGLKFIYNQDPYSNHKNNMRGQIVGDIKRNIPPAASAPKQSWAYQHAWSLIHQLWCLDPRYRPSASTIVTLLKHTARSFPLIAIQRIVLFSATANEQHWAEKWFQRTRSLLTLSLISRSFCACAIPSLYRDIRIFPIETVARLSNLVNTLDISINSRHSVDHFSSGYGYYTRTLLLCFKEDLRSFPVDIQHLLDKMTKLHTLVIKQTNIGYRPLPVYSLSSVVFGAVDLPLILDQGTLRVILPFQRLHVGGNVSGFGPPIPDVSQARQVMLLPNLREISIYENPLNWSDFVPDLLRAFKDWAMPRFDSLTCDFALSGERESALTELLRTHGRFLRYLKLTYRTLRPVPLPLSDKLSLCSNLQSLHLDSYIPVDILSLPPHPKLEILFIEAAHRGSYLDVFEEFMSSWRTRFPNLRVAKFEGDENNFPVDNKSAWLEMRFRTEDGFYTVKHNEATYKRWEGKWIGEAPSFEIGMSSLENDDDSLEEYISSD